jgi:micrococcal nuclease
VVDGDTIVVKLANGKQERVALIGVDAPERGRKGSEQSTDCINRLLASGPIGLELDTVTRDKYKRLLAYVHAGTVFVNREIVREGFAKAWPTGKNGKYGQLFADAQQAAQESGLGMWAASTSD